MCVGILLCISVAHHPLTQGPPRCDRLPRPAAKQFDPQLSDMSFGLSPVASHTGNAMVHKKTISPWRSSAASFQSSHKLDVRSRAAHVGKPRQINLQSAHRQTGHLLQKVPHSQTKHGIIMISNMTGAHKP